LEKRFIQTTGYPVYKYIYNLRIEKFVQKLVKTDMTVIEIAQELGFSDTKNIARQFKQIKGLSPLEYRKKFSIVGQSQ
jgi:LacI family transcriptional regulator